MLGRMLFLSGILSLFTACFAPAPITTDGNKKDNTVVIEQPNMTFESIDDEPNAGENGEEGAEPVVSTAEEPVVVIETPMGTIEAQLFSNTPQHRDNFVKLIEENYYDSLLFHRVMNFFMVQGGDPKSRDATATTMLGNGGPGYTIPAEFTTENVHIRGALAAARQPDQVNPEKRSSGSQFYIVHGNTVNGTFLNQIETQRGFKYTEEQRAEYIKRGGTPHLDMEYTVFGRVISGMDIVEQIAATPVNRYNRPNEDVWMKISIKPYQ